MRQHPLGARQVAVVRGPGVLCELAYHLREGQRAFGLNASVSLVALTPAIGKPSGGSDVVTLGAVADAYVRDGLAGTNFGTTADLSRRMRWGGRDTRT